MFGDKEISASRLLKSEVVVTFLLLCFFLVQFWGVFICVKWLDWFNFKAELDKSRDFYPKEHARIMKSGFGRGHDFMMNRERLQQGEYKMAKLEELEKRQDAIELRFNELHIYLGGQYCSGLEP